MNIERIRKELLKRARDLQSVEDGTIEEVKAISIEDFDDVMAEEQKRVDKESLKKEFKWHIEELVGLEVPDFNPVQEADGVAVDDFARIERAVIR